VGQTSQDLLTRSLQHIDASFAVREKDCVSLNLEIFKTPEPNQPCTIWTQYYTITILDVASEKDELDAKEVFWSVTLRTFTDKINDESARKKLNGFCDSVPSKKIYNGLNRSVKTVKIECLPQLYKKLPADVMYWLQEVFKDQDNFDPNSDDLALSSHSLSIACLCLHPNLEKEWSLSTYRSAWESLKEEMLKPKPVIRLVIRSSEK